MSFKDMLNSTKDQITKGLKDVKAATSKKPVFIDKLIDLKKQLALKNQLLNQLISKKDSIDFEMYNRMESKYKEEIDSLERQIDELNFKLEDLRTNTDEALLELNMTKESYKKELKGIQEVYSARAMTAKEYEMQKKKTESNLRNIDKQIKDKEQIIQYIGEANSVLR